MKKLFSACSIFLFLCTGLAAVESSQPDSLKVFCSPGMYSLVHDWSEGFNGASADLKVSVSEMKGVGNDLPVHSIAIVQAKNPVISDNEYTMIVGRDVIVPVMSAGNPIIEKIKSKGISPENLASYMMDPGQGTWGKLLGTDNSQPAVLYLVDDESLKEGISGFLDADIRSAGRKITKGAKEFFEAMEKDHFAIGFCKMINLTDKENAGFAEKIALVPIDRNNDGTIDHNEDIYQDLTAFMRGVWIGKYPRALTSGICAVAHGEIGLQQAAFLRWIISDGQGYLDKAGFTQLLAGEKQTGNDRLAEILSPAMAVPAARSIFTTLILGILILIIAGFLIEFIIRKGRKTISVKDLKQVTHHVLDGNRIILPGGILFDKSHTWAFMEKNGLVKVGADDFLHHVTGDLNKIELKHEGDSVSKGDEIFSICRNGKRLNLYSPVTGVIIEKNKRLETEISLLNDSPYEEGWVYRIQPANWLAENQLLQMADKYRQFIQSEIVLLKEFLADYFNSENSQVPAVVLQDGGALLDNPLDTLGPEVWEEFQVRFIDYAKMH